MQPHTHTRERTRDRGKIGCKEVLPSSPPIPPSPSPLSGASLSRGLSRWRTLQQSLYAGQIVWRVLRESELYRGELYGGYCGRVSRRERGPVRESVVLLSTPCISQMGPMCDAVTQATRSFSFPLYRSLPLSLSGLHERSLSPSLACLVRVTPVTLCESNAPLCCCYPMPTSPALLSTPHPSPPLSYPPNPSSFPFFLLHSSSAGSQARARACSLFLTLSLLCACVFACVCVCIFGVCAYVRPS